MVWVQHPIQKMDQKPSLLISFGGNALNVPNQDHPHQNEEFRIARKSMTGVAELLKKGYDKLIITHGNGPQVGQIFHQQELTKKNLSFLLEKYMEGELLLK